MRRRGRRGGRHGKGRSTRSTRADQGSGRRGGRRRGRRGTSSWSPDVESSPRLLRSSAPDPSPTEPGTASRPRGLARLAAPWLRRRRGRGTRRWLAPQATRPLVRSEPERPLVRNGPARARPRHSCGGAATADAAGTRGGGATGGPPVVNLKAHWTGRAAAAERPRPVHGPSSSDPVAARARSLGARHSRAQGSRVWSVLERRARSRDARSVSRAARRQVWKEAHHIAGRCTLRDANLRV